MAHVTERENFLMIMRGEQPLWVPRNTSANGPQDPYQKYPSVKQRIGSSAALSPYPPTPEGNRVDEWGVEYVSTEDTGGMALPKPGVFKLEDITKWHEVVKAPDLSDVNWELTCQRDLEAAKLDREKYIINTGVGGLGYFQLLMELMGFTEGMCAMHEEPEYVKELFEYMSDYYTTIIDNTIDYFKPDIVGLTDDTATANDPFMSLEMFRELLKPFYAKELKSTLDRGIPVEIHNCGRCEDHIEDWFDLGVIGWNPAQTMNDLKGIKAKYGNKLFLCGCWDSSGPVGWPDATEEMVREAVRETIDTYAKGGGFVFWGSVYGPKGDPYTENKKRWMTEELESYGRTFYNK
ncbi:MAG: veratrol--corrinoid protein metyltransferase [Anaerofustis stercorihominis]|nr:veratrol--corrinoid protein metyltransferase [Anaerofustis stercorihominis]